MLAYFTYLGETIGADYATHDPICALGVPRTKPTFLLHPEIEVGEPIIVVGEISRPSGELIVYALYTLDKQARPYQICGLNDLLIDGLEIQDMTAHYLNPRSIGRSLGRAAFDTLTTDEMIKNEITLRIWYREYLSVALQERMDIDLQRCVAVDHWPTIRFEAAITAKVTKAIKSARIHFPAYEEINLDGYPLVSIRRIGSV
jgi:hypothetical protein